jgi:hypothetical protein
MNVLRLRTLLSWVCWCVAVQAQGQTQTNLVDYPLGRYNAQVGVDAWRFSPDKPEKLLMLATNTQWQYRPVSPWGTFDGRLMLSAQATVSLKARTNQEMGSHVDELSADWAFSPSFGVKAGVLDYKTSWCRTYDIDSPWVRENDPFCTVVSTSGPSGGAPGAQAYVNLAVGGYRVQGIAGAYNPLLMNYNTREISNVTYPLYRVNKNQKQGVSINVLNLDTATEFRLGLLRAQQGAQVYGGWNTAPFHIEQTYQLAFAGLSFYITPKLNMRMQTLHHVTNSNNFSYPGALQPHFLSVKNINRTSNVLELSYQMNPQDTFALALNRYDFDAQKTQTNFPFSGYTYDSHFYQYQQSAMSAAWRRDWIRGVFTVFQVTRSRFVLEGTSAGGDQIKSANGLGFRLGYQF